MRSADPNYPSPICRLPDEILVEIVAQLATIRGVCWQIEREKARRQDNRENVSALRCLTLTCRKLYRISTPCLYASFIHPPCAPPQPIAVEDSGRRGQRQPMKETQPLDPGILRRYARTLLEKPSLREHVRYVESQFIPFNGTPFLPPTSRNPHLNIDFPESLWIEVVKAINREALTETAKYTLTRRTLWAEIFTAVVLLAKNVTHLQIEGWTAFGCKNGTDATRATFILDRPSLSHPSLHTVTIVDWPMNYPAPSANLVGSVRKYVTAPEPRDLASWNFHKHAILEEMQFNHFDPNPNPRRASASPLYGVDVQLSRNLKRFSCRWKSGLSLSTWRSSPDPHPTLNQNLKAAEMFYKPPLHFTFRQFGQDMNRYKSTLEVLRLDTSHTNRPWILTGRKYDEENSLYQTQIGSLRHFVVLKHLEVPDHAFWGIHTEAERPSLLHFLPESLETLILHVDRFSRVEESLMMLSNDCCRLPKLSSITIEYLEPSGVPRNPEILMHAFAMEKVRLTWRNKPQPEDREE